MSNLIDNLTQGERLSLASIGTDERTPPACVTVSTPPNGFRMPSMESVRMHDARISSAYYIPPASEDGDECPALDGESEEQETPAYRPYHLPSMRSRGDVVGELKGMGFTWGE